MRLGEKRLRDFHAARRLPNGRLDGALRSQSPEANDKGTGSLCTSSHPPVEHHAPGPLGPTASRHHPRNAWPASRLSPCSLTGAVLAFLSCTEGSDLAIEQAD